MRGGQRALAAARRVLTPLAVAMGLILGGSADAQTSQQIQVPSPILTLDQERLFAESAWGQRVQAEIAADSEALATENRQIEAELTAEERELTQKRKNLPATEFRALADAFDTRVVDIRREQDAKTRDLVRRNDQERQRFYSSAFNVLGEALQERGAVAILDSRAIFLASDAIDVTDELIGKIDAALGDGSELEGQVPESPAPQEGGATTSP